MVLHLWRLSQSGATVLQCLSIDLTLAIYASAAPRITALHQLHLLSPSWVSQLVPTSWARATRSHRAFQMRATYRRVSLARVFIARRDAVVTLSHPGKKIANISDPYIRESAALRVCHRTHSRSDTPEVARDVPRCKRDERENRRKYKTGVVGAGGRVAGDLLGWL